MGGVYRNDYDAAVQVSEHLELDVKDLMRENDRLKAENTRLGIVAKALLAGEPCAVLADKIVELEKENTMLSFENGMLNQTPAAQARAEADTCHRQCNKAFEELRAIRLHVRLATVVFAMAMGTVAIFNALL